MKTWKPKEGERYYGIGVNTTKDEWDVFANKWGEDTRIDHIHLRDNTIFRTKKLAQSALTKIKQVLKETEHS